MKLPKNNLNWNFNLSIQEIEDHAKTILNNNPLYYDDNKIWWKWNDDVWIKVKDHEIIEYIKKTFQAQGLSFNHKRATLLNAIKDETVSRKPIPPKRTWLQCGSKIYDIATGDIITPSSKYFIKVKLPFEIGKNEETPTIDKLFTDWVGEYNDGLYDIISFCMSPCYFLEIVFFLVGCGANGKGIFVKILTKLLGPENTTSQNIELLSDPKQRFQTVSLINKVLCKLGDGNSGIIKDTKMIKELAGESDDIRAEIKGAGFETFTNAAKLMGAFNTLPETFDKTNGFYRRTHVTIFPNKFDCEEDVFRTIPEEEFNNLTLKCLNILKNIYKTRKIKYWGTVKDRKEKYEDLSNPFKKFIEEALVLNPTGYITQSKLYEQYQKFAQKEGFNLFSFAECKARFENQGVEKIRKEVYITCTGDAYGKFHEIPFLEQQECESTVKLTLYCGFSLKKIDQIDTILT